MDVVEDHEYDLATEIIQNEIATYIRIACATARAGLGSVGDETAKARIVNEMEHLQLAEPWLPAVAAANRLRAAGLL